MSRNRELKEALKAKLRELFQFENEELDFGIYRIINYKRKEIEEFIEKELIGEIKKQLELAGEEEIKNNTLNKQFPAFRNNTPEQKVSRQEHHIFS